MDATSARRFPSRSAATADTFYTDRTFKDKRSDVMSPPDGGERQHPPIFIPANDRLRRPARITAGQLRSKPTRGTVPAYL
jgi:hypothetical protein